MSSPLHSRDDHGAEGADLIHVIYASVATESLDREDLEKLLEKSRVRNEAAGITGMLLYSEGNFFQVIEGPREAVRDLFGRISKDERHRRITTIIEEVVHHRSFGAWTMGFACVDAEELAEIPGLNDFFVGGSCMLEIDRGRARKLIGAFARGRWRVALGEEKLQPVTAS